VAGFDSGTSVNVVLPVRPSELEATSIQTEIPKLSTTGMASVVEVDIRDSEELMAIQ
jgi:hypothetical protein